ncbi:protein PHOTOSYSTEM I ASSEMBLY 2, chloroplastic-like isoform X2 [Phragmites australis]|uniref:protein PHOTOSYSTEM I ASSEMBLY 2, chloroplastic-like isoform X2 n=1 Tax=Phragmites australis TaxID=29695 RepID=UPI002D7965E8|nr:protein PHOTOSYSTEM I ASSEMBLY 2, chloroplastic-like isoform X2 [Phragmites australis]
MAQWSSAASLGRWIGPWRCSTSLPPCRASVSAVLPPRRARRKGGIGCASVPRELGAAPEAEQVEADTEEEGVVCEGCSGAGWLLCDFCKGKKNNVKSETSRVYRRCPTCKAAGYILCPRCRVYKCITFPESNES